MRNVYFCVTDFTNDHRPMEYFETRKEADEQYARLEGKHRRIERVNMATGLARLIKEEQK